MIFVLNKAYKFKIINKISDVFGPSFVLQDILENKLIMTSVYYDNEIYNLKIGMEITCYVDKINCNGRIFLEPEHPYYKIGDIHTFPFIRKSKRYDKDGNETDVLIVKDIYGNECTALPKDKNQLLDTYSPENIECKVIKIKKSQVYLANISK